MPTQIIDGFKLSSSTPIDSRMVASGSIARNSIQYKYEGLKVYDTSDKITYVWSGTDWSVDGGAGGAGSAGGVYIGAVNRVPKYISGGFTNSVIYDNSTSNTIKVGIGKSPTTYALEVNGTIQGTTLIGDYDGKGLIDSSVPINKIGKPMSTGIYILKSVDNINVWVPESTSAISVGVANNTTITTGYLTFTSGSSTGTSLYINNAGSSKSIALDASTSQLLVSSNINNQNIKPGYSFLGASSTGLYASTTEVGISLGGSKTFYSTSTSAKVSVANLVVAEFKGDGINLNKTTTITDVVVSTSFKFSSGSPVAGKVLTSDASGNAVWSYKGMPYGAIIMWSFDITSIPTDFKICNGTGFIFINGAYKAIPDLRDRNISATDTTTGAYGNVNVSPTTQQTVTLVNSNLPHHYHSIDTTAQNYTGENSGAIVTATFTGTALPDHSHIVNNSDTSSSDGGDGRVIRNGTNWDGNNDKTTNSVSAGTPKGTVSLYGYTGGLTKWQGTNVSQPINIPHLKGYKLIFLIKYNPNAITGQEGHYKTT